MDNLEMDFVANPERPARQERSVAIGIHTGNDSPSEETQMTRSNTEKPPGDILNEPTLHIGPQSRRWRRQLGPLAWAALEYFALAAHQDEQGWVAPVGVRDVAAGLGVTKDTAARAVTRLAAAGLITRSRVKIHGGRRRPGYELEMPSGVEILCRPCIQDRGGCLCDPDMAAAAEVSTPLRRRDGQRSDQPGARNIGHRGGECQPTLFDNRSLPMTLIDWAPPRITRPAPAVEELDADE